jgi:hypothetical protein
MEGGANEPNSDPMILDRQRSRGWNMTIEAKVLMVEGVTPTPTIGSTRRSHTERSPEAPNEPTMVGVGAMMPIRKIVSSS